MGVPSDKEFKTYEEMIEILKSRNVKIDDEENAVYILKNNPYYTLVNGYKDIFIKKKNSPQEVDDYQETNINELKFVYDFDRKFSSILYKYLNNIEESFKSVLSYSVSSRLGYLESDYIDKSVYNLGKLKDGKHDRDKLFEEFDKVKCGDYHQVITHYRDKYNNIPPWILISKLSLGKIITWYKLSNKDIKEDVYNHFLDSTRYSHRYNHKSLFIECFYVAHEYRNIVAHGDRVLQCEGKRALNTRSLHLYFNSKTYTTQMRNHNFGRKEMPAILIAIIVLLSNRNTIRNSFISEVQVLMTQLKLEKPSLYNKILVSNNLNQDFIDNLSRLI